jgi:DNA-binding NtrC family response regulator
MYKQARYYSLPPREFTVQALDACASYSWPGNLKELETFVKRYLLAGDKELVLSRPESDADSNANDAHSAQVLKLSLALPQEIETDFSATGSQSLKSLIQTVKSAAERNAIAATLQKTGWNRKAAAQLLMVSYRTLLYKIEQYRLAPPGQSVPPFYLHHGSQE